MSKPVFRKMGGVGGYEWVYSIEVQQPGSIDNNAADTRDIDAEEAMSMAPVYITVTNEQLRWLENHPAGSISAAVRILLHDAMKKEQ